MYSENKSIDKVIDELCWVMPQERAIMGNLADTLRAESIQEGRLEGISEGRLEGISEGRLEIARILKNEGGDSAILRKRNYLYLSREDLEISSPSSAGSPYSLKDREPSPERGKLTQNMYSPSALERFAIKKWMDLSFSSILKCFNNLKYFILSGLVDLANKVNLQRLESTNKTMDTVGVTNYLAHQMTGIPSPLARSSTDFSAIVERNDNSSNIHHNLDGSPLLLKRS